MADARATNYSIIFTFRWFPVRSKDMILCAGAELTFDSILFNEYMQSTISMTLMPSSGWLRLQLRYPVIISVTKICRQRKENCHAGGHYSTSWWSICASFMNKIITRAPAKDGLDCAMNLPSFSQRSPTSSHCNSSWCIIRDASASPQLNPNKVICADVVTSHAFTLLGIVQYWYLSCFFQERFYDETISAQGLQNILEVVTKRRYLYDTSFNTTHGWKVGLS